MTDNRSISLQKITASIEHAGRDTGEFGNKESAGISKKLKQNLGSGKLMGNITVQQIRDVVEPTIAEAGYFATAKYYIYSVKKATEVCQKHAIVEPLLTETALKFQKRYLRTDMDVK